MVQNKNSETDPHKYSQLTFGKKAKAIQWNTWHWDK